MNAKELKELLEKAPDDALVMAMDEMNHLMSVKSFTLEINNREETTGGATVWLELEDY